MKIGFSLQPRYDRPLEQVMELLEKEGFSAVSPVWSAELNVESLLAAANRLGMKIQSLHTPHGFNATLWEPSNPLCRKTADEILACIDDCGRFGVPIAVVHGWQGLIYTFENKPLDFSVFDEIVDRAEKQGVTVAFENLEGEEYLEALQKRYQNRKSVGYCWDSGHDHCYPHKTDFLSAYGQKLIMTHINDNLGMRAEEGFPTPIDDLHFLPFDGNIDWETELLRLKDKPRQEILNFELKKRSASKAEKDLIYDKLSVEEFIALAGARARKIAEMYEKIMAEQVG